MSRRDKEHPVIKRALKHPLGEVFAERLASAPLFQRIWHGTRTITIPLIIGFSILFSQVLIRLLNIFFTETAAVIVLWGLLMLILFLPSMVSKLSGGSTKVSTSHGSTPHSINQVLGPKSQHHGHLIDLVETGTTGQDFLLVRVAEVHRNLALVRLFNAAMGILLVVLWATLIVSEIILDHRTTSFYAGVVLILGIYHTIFSITVPASSLVLFLTLRSAGLLPLFRFADHGWKFSLMDELVGSGKLLLLRLTLSLLMVAGIVLLYRWDQVISSTMTDVIAALFVWGLFLLFLPWRRFGYKFLGETLDKEFNQVWKSANRSLEQWLQEHASGRADGK